VRWRLECRVDTASPSSSVSGNALEAYSLGNRSEKTPSNAISGNAFEGLLKSIAIASKAIEHPHKQRNRARSRLTTASGEGKLAPSWATRLGCCIWNLKPIVKAFWPNRRLQRTALGTERDRSFFESESRHERFPDLDCVAAEAQHVGRHFDGTLSRSRTELMVMLSKAFLC